MKKTINIILTTFSFVLLLLSLSFCEDKVTITTYYPSPYGSYKDLDVYNELNYKYRDFATGVTAQVTAKTNAVGDLHLDGTDEFQIIFDDSGRPFAYYQYFTTGPTTYCANGHIAVNYLTTGLVPQNPGSLPASGYIVCLRGREM